MEHKNNEITGRRWYKCYQLLTASQSLYIFLFYTHIYYEKSVIGSGSWHIIDILLTLDPWFSVLSAEKIMKQHYNYLLSLRLWNTTKIVYFLSLRKKL